MQFCFVRGGIQRIANAAAARGRSSVDTKGGKSGSYDDHRDDETFYVLEGELRLFLGDREITLASRQAALAPRGVPHTYRVLSDQARWIVINSPAGFEQFVRAVSELAPRDELPPAGRHGDPTELAKAAADQGIEVLGPPGMAIR